MQKKALRFLWFSFTILFFTSVVVASASTDFDEPGEESAHPGDTPFIHSVPGQEPAWESYLEWLCFTPKDLNFSCEEASYEGDKDPKYLPTIFAQLGSHTISLDVEPMSLKQCQIYLKDWEKLSDGASEYCVEAAKYPNEAFDEPLPENFESWALDKISSDLGDWNQEIGEDHYLSWNEEQLQKEEEEYKKPDLTSYSQISDMKNWIGLYPSDRVSGGSVFSIREFKGELPVVFGEEKFKEFLEILADGPQSSIEQHGSIIYFDVCEAHACGHSFHFFIDTSEDRGAGKIFVCERDDLGIPTKWYGPNGMMPGLVEPCESPGKPWWEVIEW